jgi:hypothetical protein
LGNERALSAGQQADISSNDPRVINARRAAFSILVTGSGTEAALHLMAWNDYIPPPYNELNQQLAIMSEEIVNLAKDSCREVRKKLKAGTTISFDGAWEHRRNSKRCVTTLLEQKHHRVLDYQVMSSKVPETAENYCRHPGNMEIDGLKLIFDRLGRPPEIIAYVHDKDSKASHLIQKVLKWNIREILDQGHAMKSFERQLLKYRSIFDDKMCESLRKFMKYLVRQSRYSPEDKLNYWRNTVSHFLGDHRNCPFEHKETPIWEHAGSREAVAQLEEFIQKTSWIILKCDPEFSTQANESFNRAKSKYANKDVRWGFTWEARIACAVLDRNCPFWKLALYERLGLPELCWEAKNFLRLQEARRLKQKFERCGADWLSQRTAQKIQQLEKKKQEAATKVAYKDNPFTKPKGRPRKVVPVIPSSPITPVSPAIPSPLISRGSPAIPSPLITPLSQSPAQTSPSPALSSPEKSQGPALSRLFSWMRAHPKCPEGAARQDCQ